MRSYGEDPAIPIIKKVIEQREKHLNEYQRNILAKISLSLFFKFSGHQLGERVFGLKLSLQQRFEMDSMIKADFFEK